MRIFTLVLASIVFFLSFKGCESPPADLPEIKERDTLRAVTGYNPVSYFIYRGEPMGYDYELLQRLAEHLDLKLDVSVVNSINGMFRHLSHGRSDIIAYNLTVTDERAQKVNFTNPLHSTREVLVQKRPDGWRGMGQQAIDDALKRDSTELAGDTILVRNGSAFIKTLEAISSAIEGEIHIKEAEPEVTTEQLIKQVANGEIAYTVADENIATINQAYLPNIDIEMALTKEQPIAWAVNHGSEILRDSVSNWIESQKGTEVYNVIYNKYFKNRRAFRSRVADDLFLAVGGSLSPYDDLIRKYADKIDWDWRLLAALIYQESRFDPHARSWAGAVGLMQLMPRTARAHGAQNITDPEQNIRAGVNLIQWLQDYWEDEIDDPWERQKFVLASYNVGQGHVQDARRLAEKHGADKNVWKDNVQEYMLKKAQKEYYTSDVVRHGYARGTEPVKYVESIYYIYNHYQRGAEMALGYEQTN